MHPLCFRAEVLLLLSRVVERRTDSKYCYSEAMPVACWVLTHTVSFFPATVSWWFRPGDRAQVMTTNPKPNKALKVRWAGPAWAVTGTVLAWHREDSPCPGSLTCTAQPLKRGQLCPQELAKDPRRRGGTVAQKSLALLTRKVAHRWRGGW